MNQHTLGMTIPKFQFFQDRLTTIIYLTQNWLQLHTCLALPRYIRNARYAVGEL